MDPAVPITAFDLLEYLGDRGLERRMRIGSGEPGLVIEERRPGQTGDLQQDRQRKLSLQSGDDLRFQSRPCSLKARSFFR
jgi:hypothetical protein